MENENIMSENNNMPKLGLEHSYLSTMYELFTYRAAYSS